MKILVDGAEGNELGGITARFGGSLPTQAKDGPRLPAVFTNPSNCCSSSSSKVLFQLFLHCRRLSSFMLSSSHSCCFIAKE